MATVKDWISSFRLRTLPLALSCIIGGSAAANYVHQLNWVVFGLAVLTTVLLQVLSNIANDYGDGVKGTDNENRVGPTRALQSNAISSAAMKKGIIINIILAFISGIALIYYSLHNATLNEIIAFVALGIGSIIAAITYTMGKNAYGYSGLGDLFVFIFFGIVGVTGTYYLHTHTFSWEIVLLASFVGLMSTSVLNMNNMRDIVNDKACNKNTLVVKMGSGNSKKYHTFLITMAFMLLTIHIATTPFFKWYYLLPLLTAPIFIKNLKTVKDNTIPKELDPELKKLALGTFLTMVIYGVVSFI